MTKEAHPNGTAPMRSLGANRGGSFRLGAKGGRGADAWQYIWDRLDRDEWRFGLDLAKEAAEKFNLKPVSVIEMLSRMRASGVIEQKKLPVPTTYHRGGEDIVMQRPRVHYRIAAQEIPVEAGATYEVTLS